MVLDSVLRDYAEQVAKATTATEVVGPNDSGRKRRVRKVSRILHPDRWSTNPDEARVAQEAFALLQLLLAQEAKGSSADFSVTSRKRAYEVSGVVAFRGSVANLYPCRYLRTPGDKELKTGLLKLPRSVRDNDLIQAEAATLKKIWATKRRRTAYFPRFEDVFKYRDKATSVDRQALVTRRLDGFISLRDVLDTYPDGLDARDVAWIWRRGLAAISLLSELDIVHGSIVPEHVLIHPVEHGVQLCGMITAVPAGTPVKLKVGRTGYYAPEILKKEEATTATDLYMFHRTMQRMLVRSAPRQFFSFIDGVCFERPGVRPQDARLLLGEYDDLLSRLYGPRKFRPFPPGPWGTP